MMNETYKTAIQHLQQAQFEMTAIKIAIEHADPANKDYLLEVIEHQKQSMNMATSLIQDGMAQSNSLIPIVNLVCH